MEQGVQSQGARLLVERRRICVIVNDHQDLVELLARLGDLALLVDGPAQSGLRQLSSTLMLGAKNDDPLKAVAVLLQNQTRAVLFPDLLGPTSMPVIGSRWGPSAA